MWNWPRLLRNKWLAVGLFVLILFAYEWLGLWGCATLDRMAYRRLLRRALVVDALFKHASFCKWVCPIGQFNFIASAVSPLEVKVRDPGVCARAGQWTASAARRPVPAAPAENPGRVSLPVVAQRGCELALFQPLKVGNQDCTFCLDCAHACPHDNVGLVSRLPGAELLADTPRSGVGRIRGRKDLAALVLVFTFGALLNAFGMVSPVYAVQAWLSRLLGTTNRVPILGLLFVAALVVEPAVLLGLAAWATRRATGGRRAAAAAAGHALRLQPGAPGLHRVAGALRLPLPHRGTDGHPGHPKRPGRAGPAGAGRAGLAAGRFAEGSVYPMQLGFLALGLVGAWFVAVRLGRQDHPESPWGVYLPWLLLHAVRFALAVWLMAQPMEMRGTFWEADMRGLWGRAAGVAVACLLLAGRCSPRWAAVPDRRERVAGPYVISVWCIPTWAWARSTSSSSRARDHAARGERGAGERPAADRPTAGGHLRRHAAGRGRQGAVLRRGGLRPAGAVAGSRAGERRGRHRGGPFPGGADADDVRPLGPPHLRLAVRTLRRLVALRRPETPAAPLRQGRDLLLARGDRAAAPGPGL